MEPSGIESRWKQSEGKGNFKISSGKLQRAKLRSREISNNENHLISFNVNILRYSFSFTARSKKWNKNKRNINTKDTKNVVMCISTAYDLMSFD